MDNLQTMEIRAAAVGDAVALSALSIYVFLDTYATDGIRPDIAREVFATCSADSFLARLQAPQEKEFYIAETNDHLLGFAEISSSAESPVTGLERGVEIIKLYILPGFHKKGIGKALLQVVVQRTLDLQLPLVWLTAWTGNLNAIGFYHHCGFIDIGRVNHEFENQIYENILLSKRLDGVV